MVTMKAASRTYAYAMHRMVYGILQPLAAVAVRSEDELSWTIAVRLKFWLSEHGLGYMAKMWEKRRRSWCPRRQRTNHSSRLDKGMGLDSSAGTWACCESERRALVVILAGTRELTRLYLPLFTHTGPDPLTTSPKSPKTNPTPMALLSSILGFSLFGLGARIGQLGIQKRNLFDSAFPFLPSLRPSVCLTHKVRLQTLAGTSSRCSPLVISATGHMSGTSARRCSSPRNVQRSRSGAN